MLPPGESAHTALLGERSKAVHQKSPERVVALLLLADQQAGPSSSCFAVPHDNALMLSLQLLLSFSLNEICRPTEPLVERLDWLRWHHLLGDRG